MQKYHKSQDTIPNELLPISIINEGDLDFNEFVDINDDIEYIWRINESNRIVSAFPVVPGLISVPLYLLAKLLGFDLLKYSHQLGISCAIIICSLSCVFMFLTLRIILISDKRAILFTLLYAFATNVFSTAASDLWQHGPSLLFFNISLYILLNNNKKTVALSGLFLGFLVWNRPINFLFAFPLAIYFFFKHREKLVMFSLYASIPAVFMFLYSHIYMGSIFYLGQGMNIEFTGNILKGLPGILISPSRGILIYSPIFIFSFYMLFREIFNRERDPIYKYLSISTLTFILFISKWNMWWGGSSFGYRLLCEIIPVLILFLAFIWQDVLRRYTIHKVIFYIFLVLSIYVQLLGVFIYPKGKFNIDIDYYTERLWYVRDSQIVLNTQIFLKKVGVVKIQPDNRESFVENLSCKIYCDFEEVSAKAGTYFTGELTVENTGKAAWLSTVPLGEKGKVSMGNKWIKDREELRNYRTRIFFYQDVTQGDRVLVEFDIPVPQEPGEYLLKFDLVAEHIKWFNNPCFIKVSVE